MAREKTGIQSAAETECSFWLSELGRVVAFRPLPGFERLSFPSRVDMLLAVQGYVNVGFLVQ